MPFDTFDEHGNLLLRRGFVVESSAQLARLVERGLYHEGGAGHGHAGTTHAAGPDPRGAFLGRYKGRKVSVFGLLGAVHRELEGLFSDKPTDFVERMAEVSCAVQRACALDPDAALATILLFRESRYSVRRLVQCAVICELVLTRLEHPADVRRSVLSAALTTNVSILDWQDATAATGGFRESEHEPVLRGHPAESARLLAELGVSDPVWLDIVRQHHECFDGSGYPLGLSHAAINPFAEVVTLADRYCSLISGWSERAPLQPSAALREIFAMQGKSVNPALVAPLVKEIGIYPPGSLVVLAKGDIGVVVKRTLHAHQPVVRVVKNNLNQRLPGAPKRLTKDPMFAVQSALPLEKLGFAVDPSTLWEEAFEFEEAGSGNA